MNLRFRLLLVLALAAGAPALRAQVKASLVAEDDAVQPDRPVQVALHLVHQPEWHTYWVNPGTGLPTTIKWDLPPGWKAGEIRWPAPQVLKDNTGAVIGSGYDGDLLLPVTLTPPPGLHPGDTVRLKASAEWLMCRDVCKPGRAALSLLLPVSGDNPRPDPQWSGRIRAVIARLPRADAHWTVKAWRDDRSVSLEVDPAGGKAPPGAIFDPAHVHFFGDDDIVAFDQPQGVLADAHGGFILTAPVAVDAPKDPQRLMGVLTAQAGWAPDGSLPGLRIDAAFSPGEAGGPAGGAEAAPAPPAAGLVATLGLALAGGLILNLMPCVFPVLGLKIIGFVNQAGHDRRKVVEHGLSFSAGVLLSFWALAGALAGLRAGGAELGWGFQLQSPVFVFALAALMLVFALNMSGVFEFGLAATGVGSGLQSRSGLAGSFFTGMLATVVATPCSAPFLAPALGAALALSAGESFLIFTAIAVGLCAPYLLLSLFPGAVRILPRPGKWMETFKQILAFPLYGTVGYLCWVLAGQVSENDFLMIFFGLVLVAMGAWAYGRWSAPGASPRAARWALGAGLALAALGCWVAWPRPPAPMAIEWQKWSPDAVAALRAEHRIIYVDFTARWCATCQANKKLVFHSGEVLQAFHDKNVATLRADWTNKDPEITAELARYHRSAVPFNLVWLPDRPEPVILPSLLTPGVVLDAVKG
ncbi:MAG TPA: protein-disulfide reductase DsbD domain-containing protein [Opitutaceae bacterium]|nr:protein-disulfide reductase DsbD domain-containing protein [Opitutaceae bacterium]